MKVILLALALAAATLTAYAHEVAKGANGGQVVDVAGHHVELVATGTNLVLFLTDEADRPLSSASTKNARVIIQDGGKTATITLQAAEPNQLVGTLAQPLGPGARVVFSATLADGHVIQARYVNK